MAFLLKIARSYRRAYLFIALGMGIVGVSSLLRADDATPDNSGLEQKIDNLLKQMTLEEKIGLCSGSGSGSTYRGVARLGIPDPKLTDGPRGPHDISPSTAFPSGVLLGSTWDPDLLQRAGKVMGNEARSMGDSNLLGPGINIQRDPLGGRFFEYYTEDPYLNGMLAVGLIKGVQSEGVASCVKHYICNNREDNRNFYMSMVDPRTLNEIYMPAFKAVVQQAHVWSIMTAANGVNGDFVSDSKTLLQDKLMTEWGFDGVVITDWLQTRSVEKAAFAGLDISMPGGPACGFAGPLLAAVKAGTVPESIIDDKARRVLRLYGRTGVLDHRDLATGAARNTPDHQAVAREVAAAGIVLLKNEHNILPFAPDRLHKLLVLGPSADRKFCLVGMGGSSWMQSPYEVTPLDGIRKALGDKVQYMSTEDLGSFQPIPLTVMQPINGKPGFQASYFAQGQPQPVVQRVEPQVNFMWEMRGPDPAVPPAGFHATFTGTILPPISGTYTLRVTCGGTCSLYVDPVGGAPLAYVDSSSSKPSATAIVQLTKDHPFYIRAEYDRKPGDAALSLTWETPNANQSLAGVDAAAKEADAVVFVGGIDNNLDTEGRDRTDMHFPPFQQQLINSISTINPNTVVVLINGSPLELGGWLPNVPAVVEDWYPGMEGGSALADILFGKIDPSGRLPFSWPKKLEDSPSHAIGTEDNDKVNYKEGVYVGYRYYDSKNVEPQFPFGFGLSYTKFDFGPLTVTNSGPNVSGKLTVKNSGDRDGSTTVQIYVHPLQPSIDRPVHELKAFQKVAVASGQSQDVQFILPPDAFSYFDVQSNHWVVDPGSYEIQAAASSRDIRSVAKIEVTQ